MAYNAELSYFEKLRADMPSQFHDKANLDVLLHALGRQLDDLQIFFSNLLLRFDWQSAKPDSMYQVKSDVFENPLLDLIGDIVVLTRKDAGLLTGDLTQTDVLDNETYRNYLLFKVLLNTSTCTYKDLINGIRFFLDDRNDAETIVYKEDPYLPARFVLQCPQTVCDELTHLQFIHAGGVGVVLEPFSGDVNFTQYAYFAYFVDDEVDATAMWQQTSGTVAYAMCIKGLTVTPGDQVYVYTSGKNKGLYTNVAPKPGKQNPRLVEGYTFVQGVTKTTARQYLMVATDNNIGHLDSDFILDESRLAG